MKKQMLSLLCAIALVQHSYATWFSYDRALQSARSGDYESAQAMMKSDLASHMHDAQMLYDAGVIDYRLKHYAQARNYFVHAYEQAQGDVLLQEKAAFNAGNAYFQETNYQDALNYYDYCLARNQDNESAKKNRELAQKMLEQQQQENQQNQDKKDNKDNKQNKKNDQSSGDKDSDEGSDGQDSENGDEKSDQQEKRDKGTSKDKKNNNDDASDDRSQDDQKSPDYDGNECEDQKGNQQNRKEEQERKQRDKRDAQGDDQKSGGQDKKEQESTEKTDQAGGAHDDAASAPQPPPDKINPLEKMDYHLAEMVEQQGKRDAMINKELIRQIVASQGGKNAKKPRW